MFTEFILFNPFVITAVMVGGIILVITMFGFIGNININSGGGNINISGMDAENQLIAEGDEDIDDSGASNFFVNNPVGNVLIRGSSDSSIRVHKKLYLPKATPEGEKDRAIETFNQVFLKKTGDTIELNITKIAVLSALSATVDLDISMPDHLNLKHLPGVNDINLENTTGNSDLTSNAGNMTLKNLKGKLTAHTNSGNIVAESLNNPVSVTANAGNITINSMNITPDTEKIHSNVGNVDVVIDNVDRLANVKIQSNTSNVTATINRLANVSLEAKTSMGQLNIDPQVKIISKGQAFMGGSIVGEINQAGGKLEVSSNTGQVNIKLK